MPARIPDENPLSSGIIVNVSPDTPTSTKMNLLRYVEFRSNTLTIYASRRGFFCQQAHQATFLRKVEEEFTPCLHSPDALFSLGATCTHDVCGNVDHLKPFCIDEGITNFIVRTIPLSQLTQFCSQGFETQVGIAGLSRTEYLSRQRVTTFDCENIEVSPDDLLRFSRSGISLFSAVFHVIDLDRISLCRLRGYANAQVSNFSTWSLILDVTGQCEASDIIDSILGHMQTMEELEVIPGSLLGLYTTHIFFIIEHYPNSNNFRDWHQFSWCDDSTCRSC